MTQIVLLGDIGRVVTGKTPPKANPDYWGDALDFITPTDFTDSKYIEPTRKLSKTGEKAMQRIVCPENSVIVTCIGSDMGKVALAKRPFVSNQQINALIVNEREASPDFIYYLLKSNRSLLRKYAESGGSTMPIINKSTFQKLSFNIPDIETQKKIAHILSTIDEKIELNRKMNETLERIGQALFRHYFIDNLETKKSEVKKFSDFTEVLTGKGSVKTQESKNGEIPLYGANGIMGKSENFLYNEPLVIVGRVGTLGAVRAVIGKAWYSDNVLIMRPRGRCFGFVYHLAKSFDYNSLNRGSTQPLVTQTDLKNQLVRNPNDQLLSKFESDYSLLFGQLQNNIREIQTQTSLRDILLPRLISGKVMV